jgi:hypothetical protein
MSDDCPTCTWPNRETVDMVCQTCGTDYGEPVGPIAHVVPVGDLVEHDDEECTCGPRCEPVEQPDGSICWVYTHHSLDGREASEACPYRQAPHPVPCYPGCGGVSE